MNVLLFLLTSMFLVKLVKCDAMSCTSLIFCQGDLLRVIQSSGLFRDSKTFVDMSLIRSAEKTLKHFDLFMAQTRGRPTRYEVAEFVERHFQVSNKELENWLPPDYQTNPPFLRKIRDYRMRNFAQHLVDIWPVLGRRIRREVLLNSERYSIIPIKNGFIVPGGRFREFYYWDSYWIIRGLLISDMKATAKGMIENFLDIVDTYGFIPNGGRIYYLDRSQPPLLTLMVAELMDKTGDFVWLRKRIEILDKEMAFWLKMKIVTVEKDGKAYHLARFISNSDTPRPESYIEDVKTASEHGTEWERKHCYTGIRTGAETGWDFSTRWFFDSHGGISGKLSSIDPTRIIPVDLNAYICKSFKILHKYHSKFRHREKAHFYAKKAQEWEDAIEAILYNKEDGIWYDFDIHFMKSRKYFYPSNFSPLWMETYNSKEKFRYGLNATSYLLKVGVLEYEGGIPSSLSESGEQWDKPNAWAPLQTMVIFGLEKTEVPEAQQVAREFASRWLKSLSKVVEETHEMFEKYNAIFSGVYGGGGEYEVQTGFGWSNGVVLELIEFYYIKNPTFLGEMEGEELVIEKETLIPGEKPNEYS